MSDTTPIPRQRETDPAGTMGTSRWPVHTVFGVGLAMAVAGLAAILFLFDPARHSFYPICLFKRLTGYDCPGCGGLRALHELLHGEFWQALQLNALVVVGIPLVAVWAVWAVRRRRRAGVSDGKRVLLWAWLAVIALISFGLLRNLPLWPFAVTPM